MLHFSVLWILIKCVSQLTIIITVMSAGGIDGSDFSRRKKHPDLAYRAHQVNKQIKTKHKVLILKVIQKYLVIEIYI